jgi:hypothetical protein
VEAVRAVGQELAAERGRFDPGRHRAVTVSRRGGTADRYGTPDRTGTGMHRHWNAPALECTGTGLASKRA